MMIKVKIVRLRVREGAWEIVLLILLLTHILNPITTIILNIYIINTLNSILQTTIQLSLELIDLQDMMRLKLQFILTMKFIEFIGQIIA